MGNAPSELQQRSTGTQGGSNSAPPKKPPTIKLKPSQVPAFLDENGSDKEFYFLEELAAWQVERGKLGPMSVARQPGNLPKNRWTDIVPFDDHRVVLPGDNYINASLIDDPQTGRKACYIATQGPLENTVADFWDMIWDQQCGLILMLARLVEDGKAKVHQYWPDKEMVKMRYGPMTVMLVQATTPTKDVIKRKFKLKKRGSTEARTVYQFQYEAWPDHGVPTETGSIRSLMQLVHRHKSRLTPEQLRSPVVVHCSAGVGRTGTYIAIDVVIRRFRRWLKASHEPDQFTFNFSVLVSRLRRQRRGMVQQDEQYRFCYSVAYDLINDLIREKRRGPSAPAPRPLLSPAAANVARTATPDPDILRAEEAHSTTSSSHSENPTTSESEVVDREVSAEEADLKERAAEREVEAGYGRAKELGQVDSLRLERRQTEG